MEVSSTFLYLVIALVSAAIYLYKRNATYWTRRGIAHDEPALLYGNMQGFKKNRTIRDIFTDYYRKFKNTGPFVGFFFFFKPSVMLLDLDLIRNVLIKDFNNFADRGVFYNEVDDPLSGHLFAIDGEKWKRLRSKISPTFTSGKMKFMFPTVISVVDQLIGAFDALVKQDSVVEVKDIVSRFTTDVIGNCAFGLECNSMTDPNAEFRTIGARAFVDRRHGKLLELFMMSFPVLARRLRMRENHEDIHNFYLRVVRETVAFRKKNNVKRNDFMDLMIGIMDNGKGLTIEEVAAQSFIFFLAGFETSSTTMCHALYELALNPDIQDKLRAEVDEHFDKNGGQLVYDSMAEMHYMEKVFKETLRKYTVVSILNRECQSDYHTSNPKYMIPKGMGIIIPVDAIHRDPEIYPDPEKFDPERFAPEEIQKRHPLTWLPFGDGPRNCIGLRFGKMQAFVGLAYLLRHYKFSYCELTPNPLVFDVMPFVLSAKGGIYLNVEKIR